MGVAVEVCEVWHGMSDVFRNDCPNTVWVKLQIMSLKKSYLATVNISSPNTASNLAILRRVKL